MILFRDERITRIAAARALRPRPGRRDRADRVFRLSPGGGRARVQSLLRLNREVRTATANLEAVRNQRTALDLRVSNLRPEHIDPDLLDERIRATLNLVSPDDIVIMQPTAAR